MWKRAILGVSKKVKSNPEKVKQPSIILAAEKKLVPNSGSYYRQWDIKRKKTLEQYHKEIIIGIEFLALNTISNIQLAYTLKCTQKKGNKRSEMEGYLS